MLICLWFIWTSADTNPPCVVSNKKRSFLGLRLYCTYSLMYTRSWMYIYLFELIFKTLNYVAWNIYIWNPKICCMKYSSNRQVWGMRLGRSWQFLKKRKKDSLEVWLIKFSKSIFNYIFKNMTFYSKKKSIDVLKLLRK